nr:DUF6691 family protein [uncultured Sphingomonas sp.]
MNRAGVWALLSGLLFGAGLMIGGMVIPARVRGFLDIFGAWDPTLAFVMGGAVVVMAVAWPFQRRMNKPFGASEFLLPGRQDIDGKLVGGSVLFGVGWGLAGICPGPAIASLALVPMKVLPFLVAMAAGMAAHHMLFESKKG